MRADRACEKGFHIWKPYSYKKRITKRFVNWLRVADPAATASPTLWPGHPEGQQEQQGESLLLEISLVLKWWGA